jgi:hypothetical protein
MAGLVPAMHPDFGDKDSGWQLADLTESHYYDGNETVRDCQIICNIYEDPNLLK